MYIYIYNCDIFLESYPSADILLLLLGLVLPINAFVRFHPGYGQSSVGLLAVVQVKFVPAR